MGLQAASSEEEKGDILVISSRSKEEDQPPGPALLAEARDRDPKSADLWSGAADSPAEGRAGASMGLQAASSKEDKEDIVTFSLGSEEEDQPPKPALPAEASDRDPKGADPGSGAADSPAEERARAFHGAPCCFQQGPLVLGRPQRGGLPLVRGGEIIRPRRGRPGLGVVTPGTTPGGAPYSCNDSSCSSQEDAAAKPGDLELAVA